MLERRAYAPVLLGSPLLVTSYSTREWTGYIQHVIAQLEWQRGQWSRRRAADNLRCVTQIISGLMAWALENLGRL